MAGASYRQNVINGNLIVAIGSQIIKRGCQVSPSDTRVKVDSKKSYRYPDIVIVCDNPKFHDNRNDTITNPIVFVEIPSPSTQATDRAEKLHEYTQIPDLEEYVLVSQDEYKVESFYRQDDSSWRYTYVTGVDSIINLTSIDCQLALADIYVNIEIEDDTQDS